MNYEQAINLFEYNPNTGALTNKTTRGPRALAGGVAGSLTDGYRQLEYMGKGYRIHRVVFLLMTGSFPSDQVDHINGIRDDNRWANLRDATHSENMKNAKRSSANTSGVPGVSMYRGSNRWMASIKVDGNLKHLISTADFFEACCARKSAELTYGYHANHGRNV